MVKKFWGYWLYLADGTDEVFTAKTCPPWASNAKIISLSFMNPLDLVGKTKENMDQAVPTNFLDATNYF